jgi:hypothetical protein
MGEYAVAGGNSRGVAFSNAGYANRIGHVGVARIEARFAVFDVGEV